MLHSAVELTTTDYSDATPDITTAVAKTEFTYDPATLAVDTSR